MQRKKRTAPVPGGVPIEILQLLGKMWSDLLGNTCSLFLRLVPRPICLLDNADKLFGGLLLVEKVIRQPSRLF